MKIHPKKSEHEQEQAETTEPVLTEQEAGDAVASEFEKLKAENEELQNQLLRTMADMQNMRKRYQQESMQLRQFATEDLVRDLLPVLDNFDRTILAAESGATLEAVVEGIKVVDRQFRAAMERRNVSRIKSHGELFDPDLHEAIVTEESEEHPEGTVTSEIEPGYKMAEKVIRPARVKVSKKP